MNSKAIYTSLYSVHPGVKMVQNWITTLSTKTGKSLEEWIHIVNQSEIKTTKERKEWLKSQFKLGTNSAGWIVDRAEGRNQEDSDPKAYLIAANQYVENMFSGSKSNLRHIYDALLKLSQKLGRDVKICPRKTIIPLYRKHVFAQIKPTTRTRIDLGFSLGKTTTSSRLIDTGGLAKRDRITHRIPITSLKDIDEEVWQWMQKAYDLDA